MFYMCYVKNIILKTNFTQHLLKKIKSLFLDLQPIKDKFFDII